MYLCVCTSIEWIRGCMLCSLQNKTCHVPRIHVWRTHSRRWYTVPSQIKCVLFAEQIHGEHFFKNTISTRNVIQWKRLVHSLSFQLSCLFWKNYRAKLGPFHKRDYSDLGSLLLVTIPYRNGATHCNKLQHPATHNHGV